MKENVSNMPLNTVYKFGNNDYVWSIMLNQTRNGQNKQEKPTRYTEVYRIDRDGLMKKIASGRLIENPDSDYSRRFVIYDYDQDTNLSFFIDGPEVVKIIQCNWIKVTYRSCIFQSFFRGSICKIRVSEG